MTIRITSTWPLSTMVPRRHREMRELRAAVPRGRTFLQLYGAPVAGRPRRAPCVWLLNSCSELSVVPPHRSPRLVPDRAIRAVLAEADLGVALGAEPVAVPRGAYGLARRRRVRAEADCHRDAEPLAELGADKLAPAEPHLLLAHACELELLEVVLRVVPAK